MKTIHDLLTLEGKFALITGGAGYIGTAIANALSECGAEIILVDQLDTFDTKHQYYRADLEQTSEILALAEWIQTSVGRIDVLINNAAFVGTSGLSGWAVPFEDQSIETWRRALEVNLTAPFALVQALMPTLRASSGASIINVGSIYGILGPHMDLYTGTSLGNPAAYAASKGGLIQLTRWLATVLAPDIRVNAVTLGGIWREQASQFVQRYIQHTPLARMGTEEDVIGAVTYLASDLSRYVTGHNLIVDGGWSCW